MVSDFTLYHGDCLEVMRTLPDNSVDAIVTDPPYFKVKRSEWDSAWSNERDFIEWLAVIADEWRRVLKFNGSLFCFTTPRRASRVELMLSERFTVLNHIVWNKPGSWANRAKKEDLRSFFPSSERIIFCEQIGSDSTAINSSGYAAKCAELHSFVFEPLRSYLAEEWKRAGLTIKDANVAIGAAAMAGHYFTKSQWILPTQESYRKLQKYANKGGGEYLRREYEDLRREYEDLRREYEDLRREYEDLRRPFSATTERPFTDVWTYDTVLKGDKHECEKPVAMLDHIIKTSTRENDTVLDCFMGSGSTGEACLLNHRRFIGIDADDKWVRRSESRLGSITHQSRLAV